MNHGILYGIKDKLSGEWNPISRFNNDEEAKRAFATALNQDEQQNMMQMWPDDYEMYRLAKITDEGLEMNFQKICDGTSMRTVKKREIQE